MAIPAPIAYYKFDNGSITVDSVAGTYTLTNSGAANTASGKIGYGSDFVPNSAMNNNSVIGATSYPKSFQAWVYFDSVTGDRAILSQSDGSIHYYTLKLNASSQIVFRSNNNSFAGDVNTGITATTATWYHIVVVQQSSTSVDLYVNGSATNTGAATFAATAGQFYLGYLGRSSVWYLDGRLDEVAVWNTGLTSTDVTDLYNSGSGNQYPFSSSSPVYRRMALMGVGN